jgi:hypothetical protein
MSRHVHRFSVIGGTIAIALLILGASGAVAQPAPPDLNGGTDHFACYEAVGGGPNTPITVSLTDECGITLTDIDASNSLEICNPASKTVDGVITDIEEPEAHLTFYEITQKLPANRRRVVVNNQFGVQTLRVAAPRLIAVPTVKNDEGDLARVEDELSHFTCYEASGKRILVSAGIQDQFHPDGAENILVHAPHFFCSPTEKTRGTDTSPIARDEDHLVCYKVTPSLTPPGVLPVTVENQFETDTLTVGPLHFLCVPSEAACP